MNRYALLSLFFVPVTIACGTAAEEPKSDGAATLAGSLALSSYGASLDNPVVIARALDGASYVAPAFRDGAFRLTLPSTAHYRVLVASTRADGSYQVVSDIRWGAQKAAWGSFPRGSVVLDLGTVRPAGAAIATRSSGSGSDGSDDDESDDEDSESSSTSGSSSNSSSEDAHDGCYKAGRADLPYDARPNVGQTWKLLDAFLEKGAPPKQVVDVTMEGTPWRLDELKSGAAFTITQADCDHVGNKDVGRDRVWVTWINADGSKETDHLDMRYCSGGGGGGTKTAKVASPTGKCDDEEAPVCGGGSSRSSDCDGRSMKPEDHPTDALPSCSPSTPGSGAGGTNGSVGGAGGAGTGGAAGGDGEPCTGAGDNPTTCPPAAGGGGAGGAGNVGVGGACLTTSDCAAGLRCFASACDIPLG